MTSVVLQPFHSLIDDRNFNRHLTGSSLFISRRVEKCINMCLVLSCQEWIKN